jgi:ribosome biogenesis GTPase
MYTDLKDYGFNQADFLAAQKEKKKKKSDSLIPGRIIECRRERFKVICEHGEVPAEIKGSFYLSLEEGDLFPVVGDFILL